MTRTLAIGDIHGGLRALEQILERAKVSQDDLLIFLGDYVDGWSESAQTVSFLIELSKTHNCIFMRGNHDDLTYQWLRDNTRNDTWLNHGGRSTLKSYENTSQETKEKHLEFYKNLKDYHIDKELFEIFVKEGVYKKYAKDHVKKNQIDEVDHEALF